MQNHPQLNNLMMRLCMALIADDAAKFSFENGPSAELAQECFEKIRAATPKDEHRAAAIEAIRIASASPLAWFRCAEMFIHALTFHRIPVSEVSENYKGIDERAIGIDLIFNNPNYTTL